MLQTLPSPEPQPEVIIVVGKPLPPPAGEQVLHIDRISGSELRASAPQRLDRLIERFGGSQQFRRSDSRTAHPTSQGLTLRALGGNAASRAMVVLDGVPQSDPFGGWIAWPSFSALALSEVRLIRGGGSVTAGPGALAGTLELSSWNEPVVIAVAEAGSRRSAEAEALLNGAVGSSLLSLQLKGGRGDGFIPIARASRGPADRAAPYSAWSGRLRWIAPIATDIDLQASLSAFSDRRERGLEFTSNQTDGADLSVRAVSRGRLPWTGLVYVQARQFESSFAATDAARQTARRVSLQYDVPGSAIGWSAEVRPRLGSGFDLRLGADGRWLSGRSREYANYIAGVPTRQREAGGNASHTGLFGEISRTSGALTVTAASRLDRWHIDHGSLRERSLLTGSMLVDERFAARSGWRPTGRLGAALFAGNGLTLRGAAYASWRLPTLNELFRPFRVGSDATAANPLLKPERLRGIEAGGDWHDGPWEGSATIFANRLNDPIVNVTQAMGPGNFPGVGFVAANGAYRQRKNLDAIHVLGIEARGGWKKGPWTAGISLALNHARVRATGQAAPLDRLRPAQTPSIAGVLRAGWQDARRSAELALRYEGRRFEDDLNRLRLPAAVTMDFAAALPVNTALDATVRLENLADREVISALSADGTRERSSPRTFWLGVRIRP